jgi:hypothetical protein
MREDDVDDAASDWRMRQQHFYTLLNKEYKTLVI